MNVTEVILEHHLLSNTFSSFRTIFKFPFIEKREEHNHDSNKQSQLASFLCQFTRVCGMHTHMYRCVFTYVGTHVCMYVSVHYVSVCVCMCLCTQEYVWETPRLMPGIILQHSSTLFIEVWILL